MGLLKKFFRNWTSKIKLISAFLLPSERGWTRNGDDGHHKAPRGAAGKLPRFGGRGHRGPGKVFFFFFLRWIILIFFFNWKLFFTIEWSESVSTSGHWVKKKIRFLTKKQSQTCLLVIPMQNMPLSQIWPDPAGPARPGPTVTLSKRSYLRNYLTYEVEI